MISTRRNILILATTMSLLASILGGCSRQLRESARAAFNYLVDFGFDLIVPSITTTENGAKIHTLTLGPSNFFLILQKFIDSRDNAEISLKNVPFGRSFCRY